MGIEHNRDGRRTAVLARIAARIAETEPTRPAIIRTGSTDALPIAWHA